MSDTQLAFMFPWIAGVLVYFTLWAAGIIGGPDDSDDDGPDDGIMIPAYAPSQS